MIRIRIPALASVGSFQLRDLAVRFRPAGRLERLLQGSKSALAAGIVLVSLAFPGLAQAWIVNGFIWEDENMNAIRVGEGEPTVSVLVDLYTDPDCNNTTLDGVVVHTVLSDVTTGAYSLNTRNLGGAGGGCHQVRVRPVSLQVAFPTLAHFFTTTSNQPFMFVARANNDGPLNGVDIGYAGDTNDIVIVPHTTPHLVLDSNKGGQPPTDPTQEGPEAFTVAAQICNPLPQTLENVYAFIGRDDGTASIALNVAGEFDETPLNCDGSSTTDSGGGVVDDDIRLFLLDELANGETDDATRFLGQLLPSGQCVGAFFQLGYPTQDENGTPTFCAGSVFTDDRQFDWNLWATATVDDGLNTPAEEEAPDFAFVRSMQSASQNKIDPGGSSGSRTEVDLNGDCDFADAGEGTFDGSTALSVSAGQTFCIRYVNSTWGLVNQGFDADNNGADDYDAWNQPIGERAVFDPDLVQLISMEATYGGSCGGESISVLLTDNPYVTRIDRFAPTGSCAPDVTTTYRFVVLSEPQAGDPTQIVTPYQEVASGDDNEKYNGDICPNLQSNADPFTDLSQDQRAICVPLDIQPSIIRVNKRNYISDSTANGAAATTFEQRVDFDDTLDDGGDGIVDTDPVVITHEVLYQNIGTVAVGDDNVGQQNKLVIDDDIPLYDEGFGRYVRGSASADCNLFENYGATCQPGYSDDGGATWTVFEDDICSPVTVNGVEVCDDINKIRFVLKEPVEAAEDVGDCPLPGTSDPERTDICDDTTSTDDDSSLTVDGLVVDNVGDGVGTVTFQVAYSHQFGGSLANANCPLDGNTNTELFCGVVQNIAEIRIGESGETLEQDDAFACIRENGICAATTAVLNTGFGGYVSDAGDTVIWWETDAEVGTLGFFLERRNEETGLFERLNDEMLEGLLFASPGEGNRPGGGLYQYIDYGAYSGETHTYRLVEIEVGGDANVYGPYEVTLAPDGSTTNLVTAEAESKDFGQLVSDYTKEAGNVSGAQKARNEARKAARQARRELKKSARGKGRNSNTKKLKSQGSASETPSSPGYRVAVREDGMHFIDTSTLGIGTRAALYHGGGPVATLAAEAGVYFFGEAIDSIFTLDNIYQLAGGRGASMSVSKGKKPKKAGDPDSSFDEHTHLEVDAIAATNLAPFMGLGNDDDYWFWTGIAAPGSRTLNIDVHDPDPTQAAVLTVNLHGASATDANPEHRVALSLNGQALAPQNAGDVTWDGATAHSAGFVVPAGLLLDGANSIKVSTFRDPGVSVSLVWVDSFDLGYSRRYRAVDDRVIVRSNGSDVVTVEGFTSSDILVFDVSAPASPVHVDATLVDNGAGGYRVSFYAGQASRYAVTTRAAIVRDALVEPDLASNLKDANNDAEYVLIVADELAETAEQLAQYRGAHYSTMLVRLSDVFDEFNDGINSPHAIKDFLTYAYRSWVSPPRFAVLVGDGSFDYRDLRGDGDNLVPALLASTPEGLYGADPVFGDIVGDDAAPEISISRMPVATDDELQTMIDKIVAYEAGGGAWVNDVMLIADNPDHGGAFFGNLVDIRSLIPAQYDVVQLSLASYLPGNIAGARQQVVDEFNAGKAWVNYIGHGGNDIWAAEKLLDVPAVANLTNNQAPPVVTSLTCNIARFEAPGFVTLAEALVLEPGGGVAAWSPSGRSINDEAHILNRALTSSVFEAGTATLGEAVNDALRAYAEEGRLDYLGKVYNLLGDAGLRLHKP